MTLEQAIKIDESQIRYDILNILYEECKNEDAKEILGKKLTRKLLANTWGG